MIIGPKRVIAYVTSSPYKVEENHIFYEKGTLDSGVLVSSFCEFQIRDVAVKEVLEVNLELMVREEVLKAYNQIKVPCIVEHAGLIFSSYAGQSYPGGLTKAMWDALGEKFIEETHSAGQLAFARAVVAYCDGMTIKTFVGETTGHIAEKPCGSRKFYWDTVFVPDDLSGKANGKTYAEIVDELGLEYKVLKLSQSTRAVTKFLNFLYQSRVPDLWRGR